MVTGGVGVLILGIIQTFILFVGTLAKNNLETIKKYTTKDQLGGFKDRFDRIILFLIKRRRFGREI